MATQAVRMVTIASEMLGEFVGACGQGRLQWGQQVIRLATHRYQ
ncbi:hypothetical protein IL54_2565 [Sphingobium sp. ba1]|nr:hypothetical protein IL54_2565 [Sphingobium sp. ba1]